LTTALLVAASYPHELNPTNAWRSFMLIQGVVWCSAIGSSIVWLRACSRPHPCWAIQASFGGLIAVPFVVAAATYSTGWCRKAWKAYRIAAGLAGTVQISRVLLMRTVLRDEPLYPPANQTYEGALMFGVSLLLSSIPMTPAIRLHISAAVGIASLRILHLTDLVEAEPLLTSTGCAEAMKGKEEDALSGCASDAWVASRLASEVPTNQPLQAQPQLPSARRVDLACNVASSGWRSSSSSLVSSDDFTFPARRQRLCATRFVPLFTSVPAGNQPQEERHAAGNGEFETSARYVAHRLANRYGHLLWRVLRSGHRDELHPLSRLPKDILRCINTQACDAFAEQLYQQAIRRPTLLEQLDRVHN
jgi:hypothetical protein